MVDPCTSFEIIVCIKKHPQFVMEPFYNYSQSHVMVDINKSTIFVLNNNVNFFYSIDDCL